MIKQMGLKEGSFKSEWRLSGWHS